MIEGIVPVGPFRVYSTPEHQFLDPMTLKPVDFVDISRGVKLKETKQNPE